LTLLAGTRRGAHELAAPIGVGGMGEVYRALDSYFSVFRKTGDIFLLEDF
jgi:hypothetical protein